LGSAIRRVDHAESQLSVPCRISESVLNISSVEIDQKATPPFLVGAVEQHPGIDRPPGQFIGSAHAQDDEWRRMDAVDDRSEQSNVTGPDTRITSYIAAREFTRGTHVRIPVENHKIAK
jgi:hypothetical protein